MKSKGNGMKSILALVARLWNAWDARLLVLLSLALQILLSILGGRRKYTIGKKMKLILWFAYFVADKVAIVALAKLSEISDDESADEDETLFPSSEELRALWAPILLLHLGGPDTISAYSLEDNHLWQRYLLGLVVQASVAIYVIYRCWTDSWPFMLTFPMLIAGLIKYGERTWALKYVALSDGIFQMDSSRETFVELRKQRPELDAMTVKELELLGKAYLLFDDLRKHIVNLINKSGSDWHYSISIISPVDTPLEDYFKIKEIELSFIYDALYTKATIIHTLVGSRFRFISCFCTVSTLCAFSLGTKPPHASTDIAITYVLLIGAVLLELYAIILVIYSHWAILWMVKNHKNWLVRRVLRFVAPLSLTRRKMWSDRMGQLNLLSYCIDKKPTKFSRILNFIGINDKEFKIFERILKFLDIDYKLMIKHRHVKVPQDLKNLILQMIREVNRECPVEWTPDREVKYMFPDGGKWALKKYGLKDTLQGFVDPTIVEFKRRIVIWHIATDILYYSDDLDNSSTDYSQNKDTTNMSKVLSDYMMYLLVMSPNKFSFATSYSDYWTKACDEVREKLVGRPHLTEEELCSILRREDPSSDAAIGTFREMMGTILMEANLLVKCLMEVENRWKVISSVWVELLCHTASHCQENYHAHALSEGGELLTFLWLLLLPWADYSEPEFFMF